ncbi:SEC-C domain-containing protein [Planococcus sp. CP5-4]|uniref:SEC-C metal-binding domain-containing protein n=1 Tax=unclassified Planococcus (in: firmicutes) TaxID=2662419 RepID=UPI001C20F7F3|nr:MULTISPECIES: SEC-C metal-binding domain-containing protein [unclassified Planococcus (in: firmicutes)]MBU9673918.1 SEC-C domain-containing protein [Planococcus sp. CP5-4_YE]MBV0909788.1 SEC-C domain-containing protein [Planococcus sp. CP5-4_UN]MBW6065272.1 SEC-C domain-containing protein [Planococcus sp. CP5-4]
MNNKLWIDYVSAAVQLYGIAPFGQVAEMISAQTDEEVSEYDIEQWIEDPFGGSMAKAALQKKFVYLYPGNFFVGEWIMIFDEFDSHWARQQGKPFYVPDQEELLLWSDPHYFHKPDQYYVLEEFIKTEFDGMSEEYAQGITEDIQMMAEDAFSPEKVLSEFERRELKLTAKQVQSLMQMVTDLHNNTRQQINRGHTPYELFQLEKKSLQPLPNQVRRNDPCVCGSGKKYKKCCGKSG